MGVCVCGWVYERENVLGRESARCVTKKEREREKEIEKEREKKLCISQNWNNFSFHVKTDKLSVHVTEVWPSGGSATKLHFANKQTMLIRRRIVQIRTSKISGENNK